MLQQKTLITPACISLALVVFFFWLALGYNNSLLTCASCTQLFSTFSYSKALQGLHFGLLRKCLFYCCHLRGISLFAVLKISKIAFSSSFDTSLNCESGGPRKYERYPVVHLFGGWFVFFSKLSCFSYQFSCSHPPPRCVTCSCNMFVARNFSATSTHRAR